jgi:hypothetical protein
VAKKIKTEKPVSIPEQSMVDLSNFERAKTMLILLEMAKKRHPHEKIFRWEPGALLQPLRDEFEMDRAFEILSRETKGNIKAKYETADVLSETTGKLLGMQSKTVFLRIKNDEQFFKDCKRIFAKREKEASKLIKKIEIIESQKDDKLRIFVNEDYENKKITPKKDKSYWAALLRIAKEKSFACESNRGAKSVVDFFNTNQDNMLYTRSGHALTEILTKENLTVSALIPIKMTTNKAITQRNSKTAA